MVIHDASVDRTTDGSGLVREMPLAALRELDAGAWFGEDFRGERIPTLAEVFEALGERLFINVELSNYDDLRDPLPYKVAELVRRYRMEERVLFSSFNPVALRRVRKELPAVPRGLLALHDAWSGKLARSPLGWWIAPYDALHLGRLDATPALIAREHAKGRRVHVWTVNDLDEMRKFIQWGADGIVTDDPALAVDLREG